MYNPAPSAATFRSPTSSASNRSPPPPQHPYTHQSSPPSDRPQSPTANTAHGHPVRQYFDPTAEGREKRPSRQVVQPELNSPTASSHRNHHSPTHSSSRSHHHHSPTTYSASYARPFYNADTRQPTSPRAMAPPAATAKDASPLPSPKRNIMSFSNILSSDTKPPSSASPPLPRKVIHHSPTQHRSESDHQMSDLQPLHSPSRSHHHPSNSGDAPITNGVTPPLHNGIIHTPIKHAPPMRPSDHTPREQPRPAPEKIKIAQKPKPPIQIPEKAYLAELTKLNDMESRNRFGEPDDAGFEAQRELYAQSQLKRAREAEILEERKCKRRRMASTQKLAMNLSQRAGVAKDNFFQTQEKAVADEIAANFQKEEKEKKKVQQRNRRRELARQRHEKEAIDLQRMARLTNDQEEKEQFLKAATKAEKKVSDTTRLLNGEIPNRDLREATPLAPNLDGGVMGSFATGDDGPAEPPKKKQRTGARLKKSKEQKQNEKATAAAAHAAMERGDELVPIAPKGETTRTSSRREHVPTPDSSPAYDLIYAEIWKDISRKMSRVHGIKDKSTATKVSNLRKTAQLASKEARRWQQKTNKSQKDTQARGKRSMREMLGFWKRNEREERDQRKMAEKQELESAKKAEADREANRQKRKLNFLISQTELYSHFIGKKVKTDEVERSTDDVTASSGEKIKPGKPDAHTIDLPDSVGKPGTKVTNFEDLDFDAEDETSLQQAAMANAQNAVQEAQDRARAFNQDGQLQSEFDDGELNFQNPSSMGVDIPQPKMLDCQLKEYQLKGLNWLVNLYEQGINGILADEMGLGKTVQSISVMAYLAEQHNIWGPFLVIAPSSTLHNWHQEITRFVPNLKTLPYWGNAKQRQTLRKFWDRKHITYDKDSPFHVLVTSYQLVVQDAQYFQKIRWQYMILDEAQAIKSSQSSRWKSLLGFHCRNRLLLTGTPIQNNMQELWALLHFIMPSLFDSHDEFSDWFSKDIESHAQSNTKLNEDQLKRLHMILKPFMLRRIKKNVQKELGDKIEEDVYCDLTYRQRAYYSNLRNKISIMDLIEKAAMGDDQDSHTLMNLVMQFRKVCNHPDLFERAEVSSPVSFSYFAETASFLREGHSIEVAYSVRNPIEFRLPRLIARNSGRLDIAGPDNEKAGFRERYLYNVMSVWDANSMHDSAKNNGTFSWLPFVDLSASEVSTTAHKDVFQRAIDLKPTRSLQGYSFDDDKENQGPTKSMLNIVENNRMATLAEDEDSLMYDLMNVSTRIPDKTMMNAIEPSAKPAATAPPIELYSASQGVLKERSRTFFNVPMRRALFGLSEKTESLLLTTNTPPHRHPVSSLLPAPISTKSRYTHIQCPSMRRFVTDSGKLAKLDQLLHSLKEGGHRVLLYFQMTRMIDLMEEYLTYRNYRYCRLDGSTKLEDRRDTVADFQSPGSELFVFLLSTRAGGLGINLTAADTVIFYDSDWNPTIDSQAMDRAHRLGQTRQVTVYRMITRSTIEERIRRRALQKEEVQRVVISGGTAAGGSGHGVDFNARSSRENRTKDIALWLADDEQAAAIERKEAELLEKQDKGELDAKPGKKMTKKALAAAAAKGRRELSLDDMYHEGEGNFDDASKGGLNSSLGGNGASGAATPVDGGNGNGGNGGGGGADGGGGAGGKKRKGTSKKAKSAREKLAIIDGVA